MNTPEIEILTIDAVGIPDSVPYNQSGFLLGEWCKKNGAVYYAAPKEEFSLWAACEKARKAGVLKVVVENMS
jgi:hypothetical protein